MFKIGVVVQCVLMAVDLMKHGAVTGMSFALVAVVLIYWCANEYFTTLREINAESDDE